MLVVQTGSVMTTFLLCMVNHPEVFKKVQEEIDRVIGNDRLIDYDDRESLPYFTAVLREVLRWVQLSLVTVVRKFGFVTQFAVPRWGCPVPLGEDKPQWLSDISGPTWSILGVPHMLVEEDNYRGYVIPSGTTVLANVWYSCRAPYKRLKQI